MRGLGTDHVISGPMRGLERKLHPMVQTDRQTNTQTDRQTDRQSHQVFLQNF